MTISQICDENTFECGVGITLIVLFILTFFTNVFFFVKSLIAHKAMTYELFAVLVACFDCLIMVLYEAIIKNIYLVLISNFLELLIFSLINYCFVTGFFILVYGETFHSKTLRAFFGLFCIMISIILITGLIGNPAYDCYNRFSFHWIFFSVSSLILAFNSLLFGALLIRNSLLKEKEFQRESKNYEGQHYFSQQRKILLTLSISFVIAIICSFAFDLELKNLLANEDELYCEDSSSLKLNSTKVRVIFFLRSLSWLIPLVMLPLCIYIIPYIEEKNWGSNTEVVFENNVDENSFLGGNKFNALNRDTSVLFNKSYLFKSSVAPSFIRGDKTKNNLDF